VVSSDRITWWEPYSVTKRDASHFLRSLGVVHLRWWIRPLSIAAVITAASTGALYWAYPAVQLPWVQILLGFVVVPLLLGAIMTLVVFAPRHVDIRRDRIQIAQGNSAVRIDARQVLALHLEDDDRGSFLVIRYQARARGERERRVAVAGHIDRGMLDELLGELRRQCGAHEAFS
jgi:hypothetical protein